MAMGSIKSYWQSNNSSYILVISKLHQNVQFKLLDQSSW